MHNTLHMYIIMLLPAQCGGSQSERKTKRIINFHCHETFPWCIFIYTRKFYLHEYKSEEKKKKRIRLNEEAIQNNYEHHCNL